MDINDPKIVALREKVTAAQQEFDMAVTFHEVWKPAAYDEDLHSRMGKSFASQAFLITRTALRRGMVLALIRLWDTNKQAIRMQSVAATLREKEVIDALAIDRVKGLGLPEAIGQMRDDLGKRAAEVILLVNKYKGGSHDAVLKKLFALRHERLAHRQIAPATATGANATDKEIEDFYQDNSKLVHILLGLVNAMAYYPEDTAKVYRHYASHFWAGARGEQTEGHPNYRRRPTG
jgi:AbiU2